MPDPKAYDNKDDFISACIPKVLEEGTAKDQDQAVAICNSMWDDREEKSVRGASLNSKGNRHRRRKNHGK